MNSIKRYAVLVLSFLIAGNAAFAITQKQLRHEFLILSAGDIEYRSEKPAARKKLVGQGKRAVWLAIGYIGRKSPNIEMAIASVITGVGEDAVEPLTYVLTRPDEDEAAFAAYLLGKIGSEKSAVPLMLAAKSSGERLRSVAIGALGNCGDTLAVPILIEALADTMPSVRRKAAHSLGQLKDVAAARALVPLLGDSCANIRYAASYAIASIGDSSVATLLLERFKSDSIDEIERFHIVETLGLLHSRRALPLLFELLEDPSFLDRGFACQALGHFRGNYEVANALKRSLHDASGFVRMMAGAALKSIQNG